jgi:hypothetical protein
MTEHSHSYPDIVALDCLEFMPLELLPMADPNHDDGEHQVIDAETAYVFKIMGSRGRAERIVATLNAAAALAARHSRPIAQAPIDPESANNLLARAGNAFEFIRRNLIDCLEEPQRSAFWKAVEMRNLLLAPGAISRELTGLTNRAAGESPALPSTDPRCTCAAIVNPNIPHARGCPLSSTDRATLPGHDETMANLDALTIPSTDKSGAA